MRRHAVLASLVLALGCAADVDADPSALGDPTVVVTPATDARVLVRGPASEPLPQSDEPPTYAMEVRSPLGIVPSPGRVRGGVLVLGDVLWVLPDGVLVRRDGTVLDDHVLPELAASADGRFVAYPRHALAGGGVRVLDVRTGERRTVSAGLAVADRPLFVDAERLVVVGSRASGIAGVWIVSPTNAFEPVSVTNGTLHTGRPLGAAFVPPPAFHESMRIDRGALVYDDGRAIRRVALPEAS